MNTKLAAVEAYRCGNIECARLVLADPRTVPGSLLWLWARKVLAGDSSDKRASKTADLQFEAENTRKEMGNV